MSRRIGTIITVFTHSILLTSFFVWVMCCSTIFGTNCKRQAQRQNPTSVAFCTTIKGAFAAASAKLPRFGGGGRPPGETRRNPRPSWTGSATCLGGQSGVQALLLDVIGRCKAKCWPTAVQNDAKFEARISKCLAMFAKCRASLQPRCPSARRASPSRTAW